MDCPGIRPLLDPFTEGELSPAEAQRVRVHLDRCSDCRSRASALQSLASALARLTRPEPRADLLARTLARVHRQQRPVPAWWPPFLAAGVVVALIISFIVIGEAATAFHQAGGSEYLSLVGSYPHLLLRYPGDVAMALLEAVPVGSLALGLASILLACLLAAQLLATSSIISSWPHASGRP